MSKIRKALEVVSLVMRKPVLLNRVLQDPDTWKEHVLKKHKLVQGLKVIDPAVLFGSDYHEQLKLFTFLDGGSLVTDIALLKSLAKSIPDCKYFEIGTWRGESAVNVSHAAREVFTLNIGDDEMKGLGLSQDYIDQQALFSKDHKNINHIKANSLDFDFSSLQKKFDLIFIDGSHHYHDVKNDTQKVFKHLVHENSIVVWHDYAVTPEQVRFEVFAGILDGLPSKQHKHLYHVGHTKSAIYIRKNFTANELKNPVDPEFFYSVDINYHGFKR